MQTTQDFICCECGEDLKAASSLLKHFATHVQEDGENCNKSKKLTKKAIPGLYPIHNIKKNESLKCIEVDMQSRVDNSVLKYASSSSDTDINPLKFCMVTMEEAEKTVDNPSAKKPSNKRKYPCSLCPKVFGWSTDLKRHLLIHTGERPFKCVLCDASFTRNFLLQKHQSKTHPEQNSSTIIEWQRNTKNKVKIPKLRPIDSKTRDNRKQDKKNIKRNVSSCNFHLTKSNLYQSDFYRVKDNLIYSN